MIVDLQRKICIEKDVIELFVARLCTETEEIAGKHFSVAFVSDRRMKALNKVFRGVNKTTDVLSFPYDRDDFDPDTANLGDIVISAEQAAKQADDNGLSLDIELKQLILHGALHLCGYDHASDDGEMNLRELELREIHAI